MPSNNPTLPKSHRQRTPLITAERGAPLKAQILFSAPRKTPKKRGFLLFSGHFRPFLHFCPSLAKVQFFTRFLHLPHFLPHFIKNLSCNRKSRVPSRARLFLYPLIQIVSYCGFRYFLHDIIHLVNSPPFFPEKHGYWRKML